MDANALREQARDMTSRRTDQQLATDWIVSESMPTTEAVALMRGWMMEELEKRMDALDARDAQSSTSFGPTTSRFDRWLWTDGDVVDPLPFLS